MNPALWHDRPLLAFASLALILLGSAWMVIAPRLARGHERRAGPLAWLTWAATRPALALVLWGALGYRGVDLQGFFVMYARALLSGRLPYRDFPCAHAPLFPALAAACLQLAGPLAIAGLFVLADLLAWRLLAGRDRERGLGPTEGAGWAYLAFAPVWVFTVRNQQDEALAAPFVAAALLCAERRRPVRAGLWVAAGALLTKPLFVGVALPWLLPGGRDEAPARPMALAALVPLAVVYGGLLLAGIPALQPIVLHESWFATGPTVWRMPFLFWGLDLGRAGSIPWLVVTAAVLAWLVTRRAPRLVLAAWIFAAFALLSPKFYPQYVVMWAPALAAWVADGGRARARAWAIYAPLLAVAPLLDSGPLQGLFGPGFQALAVIEMLACIGWALWLAAAVLREVKRGGGHSPVLNTIRVR